MTSALSALAISAALSADTVGVTPTFSVSFWAIDVLSTPPLGLVTTTKSPP